GDRTIGRLSELPAAGQPRQPSSGAWFGHAHALQPALRGRRPAPGMDRVRVRGAGGPGVAGPPSSTDRVMTEWMSTARTLLHNAAKEIHQYHDLDTHLDLCMALMEFERTTG